MIETIRIASYFEELHYILLNIRRVPSASHDVKRSSPFDVVGIKWSGTGLDALSFTIQTVARTSKGLKYI